MAKRCIAICLAVIMVVGLLFTTTYKAQAAEGHASIYSMLETFPMKESIPYDYRDGDISSASVYFSPALLLQDARALSGELAKASVALAMPPR